MATVKARKRKKGTVYCAEVRLKGHPRLSQTFDRKSEAVRWAEETEIALRSGNYVANELPNEMRFEDAVTKYLTEVSVNKASSTHRREIHQSKSLEFFNGRRLNEIGRAHV